MAALITSLIPERNPEKIRDRIALILGTEFANQIQLSVYSPMVTKVWIERFIPIDSETETPTINVSIHKIEYDNRTQRRCDANIIFNIDIYTSSPTSGAGGSGDQRAMLLMNKIAGMVWAILSNPVYSTLLFEPNILSAIPSVERFFVADKNTVPDALHDVVGRIQYAVKCIEMPDIQIAGTPIARATTSITLSESNQGFYYDFNPVA
jgi:hypothetical protein